MQLRYIVIRVLAMSVVTFGTHTLVAHDGDHGPSQSVVDGIKEKLGVIEAFLSKTQSVMAPLVDSQSVDPTAPSSRMALSMRALLDEMRQLQSVAREVVAEPGLHDREAAMIALQKACRDFDKMTVALQSMAKNVSQMNKEARRVAQR